MLMLASTTMEVMTSLMMLPDDLLLNCLARVSRLSYPTLALVSKRFRSLLASLERDKIRTLLGYTESCLYVCLLGNGYGGLFQWFTLCRKAIQIPDPKPRWFTPFFAPYRSYLNKYTSNNKKKLNENFLVSVPTRNSPYVGWFDKRSVVAVGSNIYNIDRHNNNSVFLDCRSHTRHKIPSMQKAKRDPCVSVLDGKIYVVGGRESIDFSNLIECFDPITQTWETVPSPDPNICGDYTYKSLAIQGKLYLLGDKSVVYNPKENRWDEVASIEKPLNWIFRSCCVIDNVLYGYGPLKTFEWYDFEARTWRVLKGLKILPNSPNDPKSVRIVDYDGKIAVLWVNEVGEEKIIWCAEISLEKRNKHEIHGKLEWCDIVLTVPKSYRLLQFLAVAV